MNGRELAKEILLLLIETNNGFEHPKHTKAAILAAKAICKAFPEDDKPHSCGFNEIPSERVFVEDDEE